MSLHDNTFAGEEWAVLIGVTTSGSHASAHWFKGFFEACRKRNLRICGVEFEEALQQKVPPLPLDILVTVPGSYSRDLDVEQVAEVVAKIKSRCGSSPVLCTALRENYQLQSSRVASALGVVTNDPSCIELIQDKPACREKLREAGVYQPQSLRIVGVAADGTANFTDAAGTPAVSPADTAGGWIVKPSTGMGSASVNHILSLNDLSTIELKSLSNGYCLEEFITGAEFSIEGLTINGQVRVYTTTAKTINERFVETGHLQPAGSDRVPASCRLEKQLQTCITALGIKCGHLHVEFWVTPEKEIVWGEFHVRQGGDFIAPDLVSAVRPGLDFYGDLVDSLRGKPLQPLPALSGYAGAKFVEANAGIVIGLAFGSQLLGEADVYWECRPGDTLQPVNNSRARAAAVLAHGNNEDIVLQTLTRVVNACSVQITPCCEKDNRIHRRIALIGANRNAIDQLASSGAAPLVICEEQELWEVKQLDQWLADNGLTSTKRVFFDYQHEPSELTEEVVEALKAEHIEGILPGLEYAVEGAACLAARLDLPGSGEIAARTLRNKVLLRQVTQGCSWGDVAFRLTTSPDDVEEFLKEQSKDIILKPVDRQASLGVIKLSPGDNLEKVFSGVVAGEELNQTITGWSGEKLVLAEECLLGDECSVEALVSQGEVIWINLTAKYVLSGEHRVEVGHEIIPIESWCWPTMQELVDKVKFSDGLLHAEFMKTADGARLIECAGRPPGDRILNLIEHAWGFSPTAAWSEIMCGYRPEVPIAPVAQAAVAFIYSLDTGLVAQLGDLSSVPRSAEVSYSVSLGQKVRPLKSSWDRLGFVLVASDTELVGDYVEARRLADSLLPVLELQ